MLATVAVSGAEAHRGLPRPSTLIAGATLRACHPWLSLSRHGGLTAAKRADRPGVAGVRRMNVLSAAVVDGLDVVPVGIEYKRAVVAL